MDCSCFNVLLAYAITISISFTILVSLYASVSCGTTQEIISGNQEKTVVEKYDILSIDNSKNVDGAAESCDCFAALGFTLLEILVMFVLGSGVIVGIFRISTYLKETIMKKKESKKSLKLQKEIELRRKIENEIQLTDRVTNNACAAKDTEKLEFP